MDSSYYGYGGYLSENGYRDDTIDSYRKSIDLFYAFIDKKYGKEKAVFEINPSDIKGFLQDKIEQGNSLKTVNKHLTILKGFFDYLWNKDIVMVDPAVKISRYKVIETKVNVMDYSFLLELLPKVLTNPDYNALRKSIFILALKGLRVSDFQIQKDNVIEKGNIVQLDLKKRIVMLVDDEKSYFIEYYYESIFNGSDYVFVTKKHKENIVPIEIMSIYTHLNAISNDYQLPQKLSLNDIRTSYAYYLHANKNYSVQKISETLGIELDSAAQLVKISIDRHMNVKEKVEIVD
ncbi:tyrosine-type recombinase/integrase [Ferdinandcohnia sp. SAFN-114]|uniref:tyrosine-type recombinase/integrase n=1 Tax=Ferdinandcohnia sp. SAFN-114 TaxID=3387275 RepID=UPI003F7FBEDF